MNDSNPFFVGLFLGFSLFGSYFILKYRSFKTLGNEIVLKAEQERVSLTEKTDKELTEKKLATEAAINERLKETTSLIDQSIQRLKEKEKRLLIGEKELLDLKKELLQQEASIREQKLSLDALSESLKTVEKELLSKVESASGMKAEEAKEALLKEVRESASEEIKTFREQMIKEAKKEADQTAQSILSTAISRLALKVSSSETIRSLSVPHEEMKGRLIGREGKNIKTIERLFQVNLIIDDTPGTVYLSGLSVERLEIAKIALQELIKAGRIHPSKIEECYESAKSSFTHKSEEEGKRACHEAGVFGLHPELIFHLGKQTFRSTVSQNLLTHSLEVSKIMGLIASECGLDAKLAKRIGLLHDLGKVLDQEHQGSHAIACRDFCLRYGEKMEVAEPIAAHHGEVNSASPYAALLLAADTISSSRPGARLESIARYAERMRAVEEVARSYACVEDAFSLLSASELFVSLKLGSLGEAEIVPFAQEIKKRIQDIPEIRANIKVRVVYERQAVVT